MTEKEAEARRVHILELQRQLPLAVDDRERRTIENQIEHLGISLFGSKREKGNKRRDKVSRRMGRSR